jgi:hypothetical protein
MSLGRLLLTYLRKKRKIERAIIEQFDEVFGRPPSFKVKIGKSGQIQIEHTNPSLPTFKIKIK